jgi:DNA polymerase
MRTALHAITDELRRLKADGVKTLSVSEESVAALRKALSAMRASSPPAAPPVQSPAARSVAGPEPVRPAAPDAKPVVAERTLPPPPIVSLPAGDKAMRWAGLKERLSADPVCRDRVRPGKQVVLGRGNLDARIFFCGEAPGAEEEVQGEPFVGPAGQLLTRMIQGMGLARGDVYLGNIMNWRPELPAPVGSMQVGNRPPTEEEMAYCLPYLKAQLEIVNPDLIVALGASAAQGLLGFGRFKTLGEVRGRWKEFAGKPVMVSYHPSYILRNPTNRSKRAIWEDLLQVMEKAALPISERQRGFFLDQ